MSSNNDIDNLSFEDAIKELSKLSEGNQIELINEYFSGQNTVNDTPFLHVILDEVSYLIERYDQEEVIIKLTGSGMYRSVVLVLIDNVQQLSPNVLVDARVLESISDDKFEELIEISNKHSLTSKSIDELALEYGIERGTLNSSLRFLRSIVVRNLQGNLAINEIDSELSLLGISPNKIDMIKKNLTKNLENFRKTIIFNSVMEGALSLNKLHMRLDKSDKGMIKIWEIMKELTDSLNGNNNGGNTSNPGIN